MRSEAEWIAEYERRNALWIHDGKPKRPHALLTSGLHSNGFFNSELVMEDPVLLDEAALDLTMKLREAGLILPHVGRVVGPAMGAITLAHDVARNISRITGKRCLRAYTEKTEDGGMVFKKTTAKLGESVLAVEDVFTTGGSVGKTGAIVESVGANVLRFMGLLVNRSGLTHIGRCQLVALISRHMSTWKAEDCPLCPRSEAIRPKGENWARLNAEY